MNMNEIAATFDLKGADRSYTPTDTDTNNTTPRPKSNRMPWMNAMNNTTNGRAPPIMVIIDNDQHTSPSVHSSTPIIITPQSQSNHSNRTHTRHSNHINNKNQNNNSINDEHESEVFSDDIDGIDDTPLLNTNKNNNPFPLTLNLKSPKVSTKHKHKSTPHPSYNRHLNSNNLKPAHININVHRMQPSNNTPNTPIPKPPKIANNGIRTLDENMSDNDSDSSFDNYLFDTNSYNNTHSSRNTIQMTNKLSNKSSNKTFINKTINTNVSITSSRNTIKNLKNINVSSPISTDLLSPIVTHTDTPISTNNSQIGYKIKSYHCGQSHHTYQTRESSLLDHEDEYDPPRGSLQLTPQPKSNGSNNNINIKNTISSPIVNGQIICSIVEEEDMDNNDESEMSFNCINNYIKVTPKNNNSNQSNRSQRFNLQRDRSRSIIMRDIDTIEPSNQWNDNDSISTMNTMNTMSERQSNKKKKLTNLQSIKNKKSHEHNGSYFFPSPKTMYKEIYGKSNSKSSNKKKNKKNDKLLKPKLKLHGYSSTDTVETDEGSVIPIKPTPNSSTGSIRSTILTNCNSVSTSSNSYNSLNSIDNSLVFVNEYSDDKNRRNVKIIRRKKDNKYRRKMHKSKHPLDFQPTLKMLSEMDTLSNHSLPEEQKVHDNKRNSNSNKNNNKGNPIYVPSDYSDSADMNYQEYIGSEYGINTNAESLQESYRHESNPSSDSYYTNTQINESPDYFSDNNSNQNSNYSFGNSIGQSNNKTDKEWNKYIYNEQWQRALQAAYLRGFNKGYSMGVQFKITNPMSHQLPHH